MKVPKTTYITSHGGPHPMHRDFVRNLGFRVGRVDKHIRWLEEQRSRPVRYLSWLVNGVALDAASDTQIILSEGFQIPPPLSKLLGRRNKQQLIVCHHVGEAPYFLATGKYSPLVERGMLRLLRAYDAHICVGHEQERLVRHVLGPGNWHVHRAYVAHVSDAKRAKLEAARPSLEGRRVVFVGAIYSDWRVHYKGLDLVAEAFSRRDGWDLTVVGLSQAAFCRLLPGFAELAPAIRFVEFTDDLPRLLEQHDLMVLPARGDTFPTVVLESMAAGLPVLVSKLTGNAEVVERADPSLVVDAEVGAVARGIQRYFESVPSTRRESAARARLVSSEFTEAASTAAFAKVLNDIAAQAPFFSPSP